MNVLIIGSGAREHALAWHISTSAKLSKLYVAPGNAGTASIATNLEIRADDIKQLREKAEKLKIDLTIVGPEIPLATGIVDYFLDHSLPIFGPTKSAAQIESSKVFSKNLMTKYGIPCASGNVFSEYSLAMDFARDHDLPMVIKADGLAAGKGVIIAKTLGEAEKALLDIMKNKIFGAAGDKVIIEQFLVGKEVSLLAFSDGTNVAPMVPACDYKRVFDNDEGPNTGGMGSYSPPGFFGAAVKQKIIDEIIKPTVSAMKKEGYPYKGVLYTGLILTGEGYKVLEYNARFGDPETQAILPRLKTDLLEIMLATINGRLHESDIQWDNNACVSVVMTSGGYPSKYETGFPISGFDKLDDQIFVFHAGTKIDNNSQVVTDGGRVLSITSAGTTLKEAREKVYQNIKYIEFKGCHYRTDIAAREVN